MITISKQYYFFAAIILAASTNAISREISYDYIQGTYASSTIDTGTTSGDIDANGFGVSGSFSITPNVAFTAGFGATSFDRFLGIDIDTTELTFGVTAHTSIAPGTDISGNFSVLMADIEVSDGFFTASDDDTGNIISVVLRHMVTDAVELNVGFSRVDVFDDTSNTFGFGARFYTNEKFSFGIGYTTGDDVDTLLLNARIDI